MEVAVFGLGYVGCVSIGCLSNDGHKVIGVDIDKSKIELINSGKATIIEKDIDELIKKGVKNKNISATTNFQKAVIESDISIICVGTPNKIDGQLELKHVHAVASDIGKALRDLKKFHTVSIRSTITPGTNKKVAEIIEKISGKKRGVDFDVVSNPEFLREGTAVEDYYYPPVTVIGAIDNSKSIQVLKDIYAKVQAPFKIVEIEVAEVIKYVNNSWHALKVSFANEIGNICKALGIDSHQVMDIFAMDKKLNLSSYYLKPGFSYGGSCLPKDLKGFIALGEYNGVKTPLLDSISKSNNMQIELAYQQICAKKPKRVAFLGISFKDGTDDLRNSPNLILAKMLNKKFELTIYDKNVYDSIKNAINNDFIKGIMEGMHNNIKPTLAETLKDADIVIIGTKDFNHKELLSHDNIYIYDLKRVIKNYKGGNYEGICW